MSLPPVDGFVWFDRFAFVMHNPSYFSQATSGCSISYSTHQYFIYGNIYIAKTLESKDLLADFILYLNEMNSYKIKNVNRQVGKREIKISIFPKSETKSVNKFVYVHFYQCIDVYIIHI